MTKAKEPSQQTPGLPPHARRAGESLKAFEAFETYCEMGAARAIRKVARKLHKSSTMIGRWASRHQWAERIPSWDAERSERLAKARDAAMKSEAELWARRQIEVRTLDWQAAEDLRKKATEILSMPVKKKTQRKDKGKTVIVHEPVNFSMASAARMLDIASHLSRLAAGVSTENLQHTGPDNAPLPTSIGQVVILELPNNGREDLPPE